MEIIIWILFIVFSLIARSFNNKNKPKAPPSDVEFEMERPPTLQDALREIQEALQQGNQPAPKEKETVLVSREVKPERVVRPSRPRQESEFQAVEQPMMRPEFIEDSFDTARRQEQERRRKQLQKKRREELEARQRELANLEKPAPLELEVIHHNDDLDHLRAILKSKKHLREAYIMNEVLGPPVSLRGPFPLSRNQP